MAEIDGARAAAGGTDNLASAIRLAVLAHYRERARSAGVDASARISDRPSDARDGA